VEATKTKTVTPTKPKEGTPRGKATVRRIADVVRKPMTQEAIKAAVDLMRILNIQL